MGVMQSDSIVDFGERTGNDQTGEFWKSTTEELIKKYGKDSSINMQTGEVRTAEDIKAESEKENESEKKE